MVLTFHKSEAGGSYRGSAYKKVLSEQSKRCTEWGH